MRLHRLEVEGFGPFRDRQIVDFDAYTADGIFLIAGRTGAGKSSILDAVCFGLYGGVPRYENGDKRLRSDHCDPDDPTSVVVEFSAGDRRWRVTRAPEYERPKRRGVGMATEPHRAILEEQVDGTWVARAARPVDVAHELELILQLTQQQFLQVILLAQNRFARFLLAKNDERQSLLRTLFGTRRFEDYEKALDLRRKAAEAALADSGNAVALLLDEAQRLVPAVTAEAADAATGEAAPGDAATSTPDRLAALSLAVQRADYRADTEGRDRDTYETAQIAADAALATLRAQRERQQLRDRSRAALRALELAAPKIDADRVALAEAHRAEIVRLPVETARKAVDQADAARAAHAKALAAWTASGESIADAASLHALIDDLTHAGGVWEAAAVVERAMPALLAEVDSARGAVADLERRAGELQRAGAERPALLAALDARLVDARAAAALATPAAQRLEALVAQRTAARAAEELAGSLRGAERRALDAAAEMRAASALVSELLQRRLGGYAGELAQALVDGDPCAVCGSREHPSPAAPTPGSVSGEEITRAEEAKDAAVLAEQTASAAARELRAEHAAVSAASGGRTVDELEADLVEATAAHATAREAERGVELMTLARVELVSETALAETALAALADETADARQRLAVLEEKCAAARRTIDEARADHDTVAARIAHTRGRLLRARALADAAEDRRVRELTEAGAIDGRDELLRDAGFADATDAQAALRSAAQRAELDARIRAHEGAIAGEKSTLLELELEMLPEEPIELAEREAAAASARAAWMAAVERAASAAQVAARLRDLVERAHRAHAAVADLEAEHATITRLAHTVSGKAPNTLRMTLETFVLAAELEEIVAAANVRLSEMSSDRYRLRHTDSVAARNAASGLGIEIMDAYTGQARPTQSLSGGETFLASLALALGLAEVVTGRAGGIRLDTLFIDEGFGSLDAETLDIAMRTLDELRQGGRTVGIISHVEAMKEQIPAQVLVEATSHGPSVIRQDAAALVG